MHDTLLEIKNISKQFPGVKALDDISFDIKKGTVHCIVGENGAGKSTFIKILTGAYKKSEGTILYNGKEFIPKSIKDAMKSGMSVLYQELNVVDQLSVEHNLVLGKEKTKFGFIRENSDDVKAVYDVLQDLDPSIKLAQKVEDLSVAKKQVIEIAKAIASESDVIIMDEPTASITEEETKRLFAIIEKLKKQNVTVIYISHRLNEIFDIGDYVTVFRDGKMIGTKTIEELSFCRDEVESCAELIKMMLGKIVVEHYIPSKVDEKSVVLEMRDVSNKKLNNISFALFRGEILGFYGLVGAGKTEIARAIYGLDEYEGKITINQKDMVNFKTIDAIRKGVALVPEERRTEGLFTKLSLKDNIPIMNMKSIASKGITSSKKTKLLAQSFIKSLRIVTRDEKQIVSQLSGGNQQKVVLSKCLNAEANIMLLDEPTRGIDVGAKEEIHNLIREMANSGKSIIVFSSEMPEIINLCDRIVLLYEGEIKDTLKNESSIDTERILHIVTGGRVEQR